MSFGPSGLKERLLSEAMNEYHRALPTRDFQPNDQTRVYRRWLDDIYSYRDGTRKPIRDDRGNVLRTWGPPTAWFDALTSRGAWPRGCGADVDFYLERNGLFLLIEWKSARGERGKGAGDNRLRSGQWRSLATLAKTGLFVVYVVEYSEPGSNDRPPTIARVRRLTDDVAPARRWRQADFGDLLCIIHQWWTNAGDSTFVRRQKKAAIYTQSWLLLNQVAAFNVRDPEESIMRRRIQHEALRLAARDEREGVTAGTAASFNQRVAFWDAELSAEASAQRSTD